MAGRHARESLNAISVARDTRTIHPTADSAVDMFRRDSGSASPLRAFTEKRTDPGFMNEAHAGLVTQGFPSEEATAVLHEVVNWPSLARRRALPTQSGQHHAIVQGVVVEETQGMPDALVLVRATVSNGKPPEVSDVAVDVQVADVATAAGLVSLVADLEPLWPEFAVRETTPGPEGAPTRVAWLGETTPPSYRDVPAGWTDRVRATAGVLGLSTLVLKSVGAANAQLVRERVDLVFIPNGITRGDKYAEELRKQGYRVVEAGQPGSAFSDLLAEFRQATTEFVRDSVFTDPATQRPIAPGQTIYHRKVGESRGPYDSFDEGSTEPCVHGANNFTAFKHADKAAKGMERIYVGFEKSWLLHCKSYPNCGVYAVRRPSERAVD